MLRQFSDLDSFLIMITIIIPIYKVEKYIRQCVDSVIAQTYRDLEIILVDDGSPDNCPQICDEYSRKDSRVKVIHKINGGLIAARKSGLKAATGEYVCFVDGDDWIEPDMYERVAESIAKHPSDCVITQFYFSYPDREDNSDYKLDHEFYTRDELEQLVYPTMLFDGAFYKFGIYPCCWTKVFKKEILEKHIYDVDDRIRMGEDIAFTYPCLMECQTVSFVDKALYHYRINPESMTKAYDSRLPEIYTIPYEALSKKSKELGVDLSEQLPYYLLYLANFVVRNEANPNNPKTKKESSAVLKALMGYQPLRESLGKIDLSKLPLHTKLLVTALKSKSITAVNIYVKLIGRTM